MQEAPRCLNKHFWCLNFIPDWNSQAAEWPNPPSTQHLLLFNYLLSYICSLVLMQKVLFKSLFIEMCAIGRRILSFLWTLICLDPCPGSSSVQITHVAILKCSDNLFLVSSEEMNLFQCCCSKFLLFGAFICQSLLCSKLVWGRTKPCSCCYQCLLGNLNWCFFWILSFGPREIFNWASQMWFDDVNC